MSWLRDLAGLALLSAPIVVTASPLYSLETRQSNASDISVCPGYKASNVLTSYSGLTADLTLAGTACNVYGTDLTDLTLTVEYQTGELYSIVAA